MRLLLVGTPDERERLRAEIDHTSFTVAGEFTTMADARSAGIDAEAILICSPAGRAFTARPFEESLTPREVEVLELLAEGLSAWRGQPHRCGAPRHPARASLAVTRPA